MRTGMGRGIERSGAGVDLGVSLDEDCSPTGASEPVFALEGGELSVLGSSGPNGPGRAAESPEPGVLAGACAARSSRSGSGGSGRLSGGGGDSIGGTSGIVGAS